MSEDWLFCAPNVSAPKRRPKPDGRIWEFRKDHHTWSCELRLRGESYGWEAMILQNGQLSVSYRLPLNEQAVRWAEDERKD